MTMKDLETLIKEKKDRVESIDKEIEALRSERRDCIIKRRKLEHLLVAANGILGEQTPAEALQEISNNLK